MQNQECYIKLQLHLINSRNKKKKNEIKIVCIKHVFH